MADKPIIKINIDSADWDKFADSFNAYREGLKSQPEAWKSVNAEIDGVKSAFESAGEAFDKLQDGAQNPKLDRNLTKVTKNAKETEKSWKGISKLIETSYRNMTGLARLGLSIGGKVGGGVIGAATAVAGATYKAGSSLAEQNATNRRLGLAPGVALDFADQYKRFGADPSLLAKIAAAKKNPDDWQGLIAAGITPDQIQSMPPQDLARLFMRNAGSAYREQGAAGGKWAEQYGVTAFADPNTLQQFGSYKPEDYDAADKKFDDNLPGYAQKQSELDKSSDFDADIDTQWHKAVNEFEKAMVPLMPMFSELAHDVVDALKAFEDSGELKKDMELLGDGFRYLIQEIGVFLKWVHGITPEGQKEEADAKAARAGTPFDEMKIVSEADDDREKEFDGDGSIPQYDRRPDSKAAKPNWAQRALISGMGGLFDITGNLIGSVTGKHDPNFIPDPDAEKHRLALTKQYGLPDNLLKATRAIESGNGKYTGPMTADGWQAQGAYQFSPSSIRDYMPGQNPYDESKQVEGAAKKYAYLLKKYGGDARKAMAAYNWGEGNLDRDLNTKRSDGTKWDDHLPAQTAEYLLKGQAYGVNFGGDPAPEKAAGGSVEKDDGMRVVTEAEDKGEAAVTAGIKGRNSQAAKEVADKKGFQPEMSIQEVGAPQPPILTRPGGMGATRLPTVNFKVDVTAPAGSSVAVTSAGLPQ